MSELAASDSPPVAALVVPSTPPNGGVFGWLWRAAEGWLERMGARGARWRLTLRRWQETRSGAHRDRVLATICWQFPIYSQTFVYEELGQLISSNFDLCLLYSELEGREQLPDAFIALWERKQRSFLEPATAVRDLAYYRRRMPKRVESLLDRLSQASGRSVDDLTSDPHIRMAFSYARLVEAYRPDYLHSYFFYEGTLFTFVASQLLEIPRGVSCYADHMLADFPLKLVPLHLATADVVVATSERIGEELRALHPTPDVRNILVKPNAIDTERFPVQVRVEPGAAEPFMILCVARLEPKKGLLDLVDAVRAVRDRGIDAELHLIGTNDASAAGMAYHDCLVSRIEQLQIGGHVTLHGRRPPEEVREFLQRAHVFVAPFVELDSGDKDGIPTALLEAMSTGAAIVATDAGSITEPIRAGENGVVVEQRNPEALAQALAALLADATRRAALGQAAARTVREFYDVRHCDARLHARIRQVLAERTASRR